MNFAPREQGQTMPELFIIFVLMAFLLYILVLLMAPYLLYSLGLIPNQH